MDKYIRFEDAINAIKELPDSPNGFSDTYDKAHIIAELEDVPAADVRPVVRAKWENRFNFYLKCSNCREPYAVSDVCGCKQSRNFCPHCGADMREPPKEET